MTRSSRSSASVALPTEYELLGEGDTGGRRRLCEHRDCLRDAPRHRRFAIAGLDGHVVAVVGVDLTLEPGLDAGVLQVVEQILGLVLEPQDRDARAFSAVGQRYAVNPLS